MCDCQGETGGAMQAEDEGQEWSAAAGPSGGSSHQACCQSG